MHRRIGISRSDRFCHFTVFVLSQCFLNLRAGLQSESQGCKLVLRDRGAALERLRGTAAVPLAGDGHACEGGARRHQCARCSYQYGYRTFCPTACCASRLCAAIAIDLIALRHRGASVPAGLPVHPRAGRRWRGTVVFALLSAIRCRFACEWPLRHPDRHHHAAPADCTVLCVGNACTSAARHVAGKLGDAPRWHNSPGQCRNDDDHR